MGYLLIQMNNPDNLIILRKFRPSVHSTVYDINRKEIGKLFQKQRDIIHLKDIPQSVINSFLAVEDRNFYNHIGIDFRGILRAFITNIKAGKIVQGGSTITQQLAKLIFTSRKRNFQRKFKELILALQIENNFSKNEILEMYFNHIFLGHGCYGLSTASKFYFDKPISKLSFIEASILASLPKAPNTYSPFKQPHLARKKHLQVLYRLAKLGYIPHDTVQDIHQNFWKIYWQQLLLTPSSKTTFSNQTQKAPYFVEQVRQELTYLFGEDFLYSKGLQIFTTLDLRHQDIAQKHVLNQIKQTDYLANQASKNLLKNIDTSLEKIYNIMSILLPLKKIQKDTSDSKKVRSYIKKHLIEIIYTYSISYSLANIKNMSFNFLRKNHSQLSNIQTQVAFASLEPHTGRITSMIGGRKFQSSDQFNRAISARRQPGSAFKPFVYGTAIEERKVHTNKHILDAPILNVQPDGTIWTPRNYTNKHKGSVPLIQAFASSLNTISVQVFEDVGKEAVAKFANKLMKLSPDRLRLDSALALGASEITPMELLRGISIIANQGKEVIPHYIIYVTDQNGKLIYNQEKEILQYISSKKQNNTEQVIEPEVAYILHQLLMSVVNRGTAYKVIREYVKLKGAAAGKTGTTSSWNDAWFVGYTKNISAVVWSGIDNGNLTLGKGASGGSISAPVWGNFMSDVYGDNYEKSFNFKKPENIISRLVCKENGKYLNDECQTTCTPIITLAAPTKSIENENGELKHLKLSEDQWDCEEKSNSRSFDALIREKNNITEEKSNTE